MADAAFSAFIDQVLEQAAIVAAFGTNIKRRQVNVLREEDFPVLATWVERDGEDTGSGSDGEITYECEYTFLVAARLGEGEKQDVILGRLLKTVKDVIDSVSITGANFTTGDWSADNDAAEGEGDRVWAEFGVSIVYYRPRGNY